MTTTADTASEEFSPGPDTLYPCKNPDGTTSRNHIFLKNAITNPNIIVGDYTSYHDFVDPKNFEVRNAGYFPAQHSIRLYIGKYCSIAHGAQFLSSVTNHHMDGFSTYPFPAVWGEAAGYDYYWPDKGDTRIGNDVWIGCEATIMPGITIGDGAIIGTRAVVTKDLPPYTIVAGNPATQIRVRFDQKIIDQLLEIRWWDWPNAVVVKNASAIVSGDLDRIRQIADSLS